MPCPTERAVQARGQRAAKMLQREKLVMAED